ncbi:hypothetical protein MW871_02010 [Flavobacterium sp. I-SCBP12n]|uniref:Uncharacterized protein n=2 Tax=Flavobacterium TaxID=237 RepID=A0A9X1XNR1_9FLAO|nr:hypothetical protein [Flavobacterium pygoscelis]MCK8140660.1 hypothetical protein [Flavobacterium pygoscelis]
MKSQQLNSEADFVKFHKRLSDKLHSGFKIIEQNNKLPYVVLAKETKNIDHSFHLFLSCITMGIWFFVWIYLIINYRQKKQILMALDEDGNVFEDRCLLLKKKN